MANDKIFDPTKLKIVDCKIVEGEIKAPFEFDTDSIINYDTQLAFNASLDIDNKIVKVDIGFDIKTNSEHEQDEAIAKFNLVYLFEVDNLDAYIIDDEEEEIDEMKLKAEFNLVIAISAIAFSTSRGILMTRLQGTVMKDYILPIIDPMKLHKGIEQQKK